MSEKLIHWAIADEGDTMACGGFGYAVAVTSPFDHEALKVTCPMCAARLVAKMSQC